MIGRLTMCNTGEKENFCKYSGEKFQKIHFPNKYIKRQNHVKVFAVRTYKQSSTRCMRTI